MAQATRTTSKAQDVRDEAAAQAHDAEVLAAEAAIDAELAQGTQAQGTQAQGMAAVLAAAVAQGAQAAANPKASRSTKAAYGVFVTVPEGHMVCVRYDGKTGRELASWWLLAADGSWALMMRTKRDALAWLDANGDSKAQAQAAAKLAGGASKAQAQAQAARAEILASSKR